MAPTNILRRPAVERMTGLSRSSIYALMAKSQFPKPTHRLSARAVGWSESAVNDWLKTREVTA